MQCARNWITSSNFELFARDDVFDAVLREIADSLPASRDTALCVRPAANVSPGFEITQQSTTPKVPMIVPSTFLHRSYDFRRRSRTAEEVVHKGTRGCWRLQPRQGRRYPEHQQQRLLMIHTQETRRFGEEEPESTAAAAATARELSLWTVKATTTAPHKKTTTEWASSHARTAAKAETTHEEVFVGFAGGKISPAAVPPLPLLLRAQTRPAWEDETRGRGRRLLHQ